MGVEVHRHKIDNNRLVIYVIMYFVIPLWYFTHVRSRTEICIVLRALRKSRRIA